AVRVNGHSVACAPTRRSKDGLARSSPPRSEEEAEGQVGPAEAVLAFGATADAGGADPEGTEAAAGHRRRDDRRGLIGRGPARERDLPVRPQIDRSVTDTWR